MTVGELRAELAQFSDDTPLVFLHHPENYQECDVEFCGFHPGEFDGAVVAECFLKLIDWEGNDDDEDEDEEESGVHE